MSEQSAPPNPFAAAVLHPWHEHEFRQLRGLHERQRLGHAWLLSGQHGIGKRALALHFAHYLLCSNPADGMPCGNCSDCHLFVKGNHPDCMLVVPEKKLITVDLVRDAIDFAHNTSQRGGMQVLIFDPAENMNLNAANALLKLLEEPSPQTLLLLIGHQPGLLLATIRSRCQHLRLGIPEHNLARDWMERQGFAGNASAVLLKAGGAPLRALAQGGVDANTERLTLLQCLEAVVDSSMYPVEAAKKCEKFSIIASIDYLLQCVADLAAFAQSGLPLKDSDLTGLAAKLGFRGEASSHAMPLHAMHASLTEARKVALASNNANAQLMMEALFAQWHRVARTRA